MVFGKDFDQILRWDLARHNQTNLSIKTVKKQDQNELKTIYLKYGIRIT